MKEIINNNSNLEKRNNKKIQEQTILTIDYILAIENNEDYNSNTKHNLDYYSLNYDLLLDFSFLDKIEEYGKDYFVFYCYLKTQMLNSGRYYILFNSVKRLIKNYCLNFDSDLNNVYKILEDLIKSKYIYKLQDNRLFEGEAFITDSAIVYNYELTNYKRAKERKDQQRKRANKNKEEIIEEAPSSPIEIKEHKFTEAEISEMLDNSDPDEFF